VPGRFVAQPSSEAITLFTSMFLHDPTSYLHLGGNMLFLWIFGDNVEARLGRVGYLAAYLATGFAATLLHGAVDTGSAIPGLGASGAISGVQGLYIVLFPRNRVKLFVAMYVVTVLHVQALWMILAWFVLQDLLPFLIQTSVMGGSAALAGFPGARAAAARGPRRPGNPSASSRAVSAHAPWAAVDPYRRAARGGRATSSTRPNRGVGPAASRSRRSGPGRTTNLDGLRARAGHRPHAREQHLGSRRTRTGTSALDPRLPAAASVAVQLGMILLRGTGIRRPRALPRAPAGAPDPTVRALALRELGYQ
jgi:membrane associated rhomboid family serine protease